METVTAIFIAIMIVAILYLPTLTAFKRKTKNRVKVFILNTFLGWTGIGWVIALMMSYDNEIEN